MLKSLTTTSQPLKNTMDSSIVLITGSAVMFGKDGILSVIASLIGATSLLLNAKGNPIGQALGVISAYSMR